MSEEKKKTMTFSEGIIEASKILSDCPEALQITIVNKPNNEGGQIRAYAFVENDRKAKDCRRSIKAVLREVYESGAYSNEQFASALRVDVKAIQGLLDDEFIAAQGL